jgi:hypothetical protein
MCKPATTEKDSDAEAVCAGEEASDTVTLNEALAAAVGTPEIVPVALFKLKPAGNVPVRDHVYGVIPPVAESERMKELPMVAVGGVTAAIAKGAVTTIVSGNVAVCGGVLESVICSVKL